MGEEGFDFESVINGEFDPTVIALSESVVRVNKLIDSVGQLHAHAMSVGLPIEVANEIALTYFDIQTGVTPCED